MEGAITSGHRRGRPAEVVRPVTDWVSRFMGLAAQVATWSKDPNRQVGAVVVSPDRRRFSVGYNGLPKGFDSLEELGDDLTDEDKNAYSLHAEANAIAQAGTDLTSWAIFVTTAPCLECALAIHRAGIKYVFSPRPDPDSSWYKGQVRAHDFLVRAGIDVGYV